MFVCLGLSALCADTAFGAVRVSPEYKLKAAFINRFAMFIDWPAEKNPEEDDPYIIGVIGEDPFKKHLDDITSKPIRGRSVVIERFAGMSIKEDSGKHPKIDEIRKCHILYISTSEKKSVGLLIDQLKDHNVLTISDMSDFIDHGGIIQFINEDQKVRFAINLKIAKAENLEIRSKLLRLAKDIKK